MRCQDFERLILESGERELAQEERTVLQEHLEICSDCAALQSFRGDIRRYLQEPTGAELSAEFSDNVRLRCRAEVESLSARRAGKDVQKRPATVPWTIWAALLVLTGLTLSFLIPGLDEWRRSQKLTLGTALVLVVILQNALMLLFTPLLMRREPSSQFRFRKIS